MRLASLPMYDLEELRAATDTWWRGIATALRQVGLDQVPEELDRGRETRSLWHDPALLLSQTCGYPLTHELKGAVTLVATPVYEAPGCKGADYSSVILVREDEEAGSLAELAGRTCAYNAPHSQSGYNCLRSLIAPHAGGQAFFSGTLVTGGHLASMEAVRDGKADIAAVDCVTFDLFSRHRPEAVSGLRILQYSAPAPALPYITKGGESPDVLDRLRQALKMAIADPKLEPARQSLRLKGFAALPSEDYRRIDEMETEALALGYPELA